MAPARARGIHVRFSIGTARLKCFCPPGNKAETIPGDQALTIVASALCRRRVRGSRAFTPPRRCY